MNKGLFRVNNLYTLCSFVRYINPMRSHKEQSIDNRIMDTLKKQGISDKARDAIGLILADEEVQAIQEYANNVSIVRMGFNDHGPVHMRIVAMNVIIMMNILKEAGVKMNLETEGVGDFEDSLIGAVYAAMLHDTGMSVGRHEHELHSAHLSLPIIDRLLSHAFPGNIHKRIIIRSTALEGIYGHMGSRSVHSLEAGVVQVADGCDMTKGMARISMALSNNPKVGDIHQYSANSIEEVRLSKGREHPIHIDVLMSSEVGLFQVEEVLLAKIASSTAKSHIELYAQVDGREPKRYL